MRPSEVLRRATTYLEGHDVEGARESAEALLASVLVTDRAGIYSRSEGLSSAEARAFGRALCRRCTGTPLQHLTGEQPFRRITLRVAPGVFVPRPETEVVAGIALDLVAAFRQPVLADVGTGTGAIALSIKDEHPDARVMATDVSPDAVALARENAAALDLDVEILEGEGLTPLPEHLHGTLDLVVSNPPYVTSEELEHVSAEVLADPRLALEGGVDVYRELTRQAAGWLRPGGFLVVEIGAAQAEEVGELFSKEFDDVQVASDLAGRDRVVIGSRR